MAAARSDGPSLLWPGVLVGTGLAGTLDEVVLHQLLGWHHFYDRSTATVGLVSDGVFHLFSTAVLLVGVVLLVERRHTTPDPPRLALAGILLGAGCFNLYDGTVQHKLLRLHQIRPDAPDHLPYDVTFLAVAAALATTGALLLRRVRQPSQPPISLAHPRRPSVHSGIAPTSFGSPAGPSGVVVAHPTRNRKVVGSNPTSGST